MLLCFKAQIISEQEQIVDDSELYNVSEWLSELDYYIDNTSKAVYSEWRSYES
jgi:hypothetical protein